MAADKSAKSPFKKLVHVGVVVRDIEKTVERLESLGIGPFAEPPLPPVEASIYYRGKQSHSEVKILQTKIGEIELELFQPVSGEDPWRGLGFDADQSPRLGRHFRSPHEGHCPDRHDRELADRVVQEMLKWANARRRWRFPSARTWSHAIIPHPVLRNGVGHP